ARFDGLEPPGALELLAFFLDTRLAVRSLASPRFSLALPASPQRKAGPCTALRRETMTWPSALERPHPAAGSRVRRSQWPRSRGRSAEARGSRLAAFAATILACLPITP